MDDERENINEISENDEVERVGNKFRKLTEKICAKESREKNVTNNDLVERGRYVEGEGEPENSKVNEIVNEYCFEKVTEKSNAQSRGVYSYDTVLQSFIPLSFEKELVSIYIL